MKRKILLFTIIFSGMLASCERDFEPAPEVTAGTDLSDTKWVKTFLIGKKTCYIFFFSEPLEEGVNSLQAKIYLENMRPITGYRIEIDPRMPDMENHSSPNNKPLEWNTGDSVYQGTLNLTMTGWWRLNLKIYDDAGELIGGSTVERQGSSTLYWDVDI